MSSISSGSSRSSMTPKEARATLPSSLHSFGVNYTAESYSRAADVHATEKTIAKQRKDVEYGTRKLRKQNDQLEKMAITGHEKIKEIGDVQNWAEMLERDFLVLEETLNLVDAESMNGHAENGFGGLGNGQGGLWNGYANGK